MTLSSERNASDPMPGNGLSNTWTTDVRFQSAEEVALYLRSGGGGNTRIDPAFYAVALIDGGDGGCVVTYPLDSTRVSAAQAVLIRREPGFTQPVGLVNQGAWNPQVVERALDHGVMLSQDLKDRISKTIRIPFTETIGAVVPRDGQPLKWQLNADGTWSLLTGELEGVIPAGQRVLYAQDLGLNGDGTDESEAISAALAAHTVGGSGVFYLKAPAGYWQIDGELQLPSGAQVQFGSIIRRGRNGSIVMKGYFALASTAASVATTTFFGAATIPIAGVDSLSTVFAVGDWIDFGSERNRIVTGLDAEAGTIDIGVATDFDLSAGAAISRIIGSPLTSSLAMESRVQAIPVADPSLFPVGSMVLLLDGETVSGLTVNSEQAIVVGTTATTVIVDRPIRHPFSTANGARLHLLNPCRNASVSGVTVENTEAPTAVVVDMVAMRYAYRCKAQAAACPNTDDFGARGQFISRYRSLECDVEDVWVGTPKYLGIQESYAVTLRESTGCKSLRVDGVGVNGVVSYAACTDCWDDLTSGRLWQDALLRWAGLREIGCNSYDVSGSGGSVAGQAALRFGTSLYAGGCFDCGVDGGEVSGINGTGAAAISILAPTDNLSVKGITFRGGATAIYAENRSDGPSLEVGKVVIACDFHDFDTAANVDMNKAGGSGRPFNVLDLTGSRFFNWINGIHADNLDAFVMEHFVLRTTRASASSFGVDLQSITAAFVSQGSFDGAYAVAKIVSCPLDLTRYDVRNPGSSTILSEVGSGSTGWRDAYGFYPAGFTPVRSVNSDGTVLSLPGME